MRRRYSPVVYRAMRDGGLSNRKIAELLDVDEATVRRGLKGWRPRKLTTRELLMELADRLDA